jgi:hypothetical protein
MEGRFFKDKLSVLGDVGIGTTNPNYKLEVDGTTDFGNTTTYDNAAAGLISWNSGTKFKIRGQSGHALSLGANGTEDYVWINTDGNVGIGTAEPQGKLDINTETAEPTHVYINGEVNQNKLLYFRHYANSEAAANNVALGYIGSNGIDNLLSLGHLNASGTDVPIMHLTEAGNVGIGTDDPVSTLEIVNNNESTTQTNFTQALSSAGLIINTQYTANAYTPGLFWKTSNSHVTKPKAGIYLKETSAGTNMYFGTSNNYSTGITNDALVINQNGRVGIGTTDPDSLLMVYKSAADSIIHVRGASSGADARVRINGYNSSELYIDRNGVGRFAFRRTTGTDDLSLLKLNDDYSDNSTIMFWDYSTGNVGIGTANPLFKLHVNGDIYQDAGYSIYSNVNRGWYRGNYTTTGSGVSNGKIVTLNPAHGQTASSTYHYIFELTTIGTGTNSGATYIGVYSADASAWSLRAVSLSGGSSNHPQLSVSGNNFTVYTNHSSNYTVVVSVTSVYNGDADSTAHSLGANYQWQRAVNDLYYNDGLVGIGTGTPSQKLHVQGNLRLTGALYDSNNATGTSGQVLTSTGSATDWKDLDEISGVTGSGSGTTNYVTKWTDGAAEVIGNSLIYDNGTNVGISTASPSAKLHVHSTTGILHTGDDFYSWVLKYLSNQSQSSTTVNYYLIAAKTQTNVRLDGVLKGARQSGVSANSGGGTRILFNTNNATTPLAIGGLESWGTDHPSYGHPIFTIVELTYNAVEYYALRISPSSSWVASFLHTQFEGIANSVLFTNVGDGDVSNVSDFSGSEAVFSYQYGKLGIGTASPQAQLHIYGGDLDTRAYQQSSSTNSIYLNPTNGNANGTSNTGGGGVIWKPWYNNYTKKSAGILAIGEGNYFRSGLAFYTNNNADQTTDWSERMRIDMDGNVGIGTVAPQRPFTLYKASSPVIQLVNSTTGTAAADGMLLTQSGVDSYIENGEVGKMFFRTSATNRVTIDSSGNVGIGTVSPGSKLDVNGMIKAGIAGNSSANTPALLVSSAGVNPEQSAIAIQQGTNEGDTIIFADYEPYVEWGLSTDNGLNTIEFTGGTNTNNLGSKTLYNQSGNARTAYKKAIVELTSGNMSVGGSVGIGTVSPNQKLEVFGNQRISNNGVLEFFGGTVYPKISRNGTSGGLIIDTAGGGVSNSVPLLSVRENGGTDFVTVLGSGNVGIGTDDPSYKFELTSDAGSGLISRIYNTNLDGQGLLIRAGSTANATRVLQLASENDTKIMTVNSNGKVGIGTTLPAQKLEVNGGRVFINNGTNISPDSSGNGQFNIQGSGYTGYMTLDGTSMYVGHNSLLRDLRLQTNETDRVTIDGSTGNVGIGTTDPTKKLHVNGDVRIIGHTVNEGWLQAAGSNFSVGSNSYGVFLGTYSGGTSISPGEIILSTQAKTGWGVGDGLGRIRFFLGDTSGVGVRDVAKIEAVNEVGDGSTTTTAAGGLAFHTSPFNSQVVERMRIDKDGKVGIGTTSPSSLLNLNDASNNLSHQIEFSYVNGGTKTDAFTIGRNSSTGNLEFHSDINNHGFEFKHNAAGTQEFNILNMNVGIGTTIPNNELVVSDGVQPSYTPAVGGEYIEIARTSGADAGFLINKNTGQWLFGIDNSDGTNPPLRFEYSAAGSAHAGFGNATLGLALKYDGKVGIGTVSPTEELHVAGAGRFTSGVIVPETTNGGFEYRTNSAWGGWARDAFTIANGTGVKFFSLGGYGGSGTTFTYGYIGKSYTDYCIRFYLDGGVDLTHNDVTKLSTTSAGATVTGKLTVSTIDTDASLTNFVVVDSNGELHKRTSGASGNFWVFR